MVPTKDPTWQIRILIDGECPLCAREGRYLERLDGGRGGIQLEDLSSADFDPSKYGLDQATVEARIHGILPDGTVVEGVEVFSRAYSAVGVTWVATLSEWRGVRWLLDRLYLVFAKNRLRITGRAPKQCAIGPTGPACESEQLDRSR
jgi:predicted DCC family thiol-disulfide oxidoreductase YuxK